MTAGTWSGATSILSGNTSSDAPHFEGRARVFVGWLVTFQMKRAIVLFYCCLMLQAAGCQTIPKQASPPPEVVNPTREDAYSLFFRGTGRGTRFETAERAAKEDALRMIYDKLGGAIPISRIEPKMEITDTTPLQDGYVYMWVAYPKSEVRVVEGKLAKGRVLSRDFKEAHRLFASGESREAEALLTAILQEYNDGLKQDFIIEEAHLLLGDVYGVGGLNRYNDARVQYEAIIRSKDTGIKCGDLKRQARKKLTHLDRQHPQPLMWPLRDRFENQKVALLCCIHHEGEYSVSNRLLSILMGECRKAGIEAVGIGRDLGRDGFESVFYDQDIRAASAEASSIGAGYILGVLIEVDPEKHSKPYILKVGDSVRANPDSIVRHFVARTTDGNIMYSGNFVDRLERGEGAISRILINNYLIPKWKSGR